MTLIADSLDEYDQLAAYKELRRARRRNRITKLDLFDAFYKAYLTGIVAVAAIYGGGQALGQRKLDAYHLHVLQDRGGAFAGLLVALAIAIGLRSGGRGGPLAFERADVRHLLMSPIDKRNTIRAPALRQLRHTAFLGLAVGAAAGIVVANRLPYSLFVWVAVGALFGLLTITTAFGVALLAGGLRIPRWLADFLGLLVLAWSSLDADLKFKTSPMTWLGTTLTWPMKFDWIGLMSIVVAGLTALLGALYVNRLSIEAAERRSRLIGQLRFAATLQDVRTVMVLQRQLAQEHTRVRPWIRLRPSVRVGVNQAKRVALGVYVRRSLAGMLRWPLVRYARLLVFVAIAALSTIGIWGGTPALIVVGGIALWLAALDLVEGLAQEVDHPDRVESMPRSAGVVYQCHLIVPGVVLFVLECIAYLLLNELGDSAIVSRLSPVVVISTLSAIGGAAMAVTQKPSIPTGTIETPEIAGVKFILRTILPPAIAIAGLLPIVGAAKGWEQTHTVSGLVQRQSSFTLLSLIIAVWPVAWLRYRDEFRRFMSNSAPVVQNAEDTQKKSEDKRNAHRQDIRKKANVDPRAKKSKGKK